MIFPLKGLDLGPYLSTDRPTYAHKAEGTSTINRNGDLSASLMTADVTSKDLKRSPHGDDYPMSVGSPNQESVADNSPRSPDNIPDETFDARMFAPVYDLLGVSHHCGTLSGGHYVTHVDTNAYVVEKPLHSQSSQSDAHMLAEGSQSSDPSDCVAAANSTGTGTGTGSRARESEGPRWMCFNDEQVSPALPIDVIGPSAYVLFYRLREY